MSQKSEPARMNRKRKFKQRANKGARKKPRWKYEMQRGIRKA